MKVLINCVLLLALFATSLAFSATWGRRNGSDFLIYSERVVRAKVANSYSSVNVNYPSSGYNGLYNISCVNATDNFRNTSGATPSLWSGGPGYRYAQVNLKSLVNQGIDSTVFIYGR